ncbi:MAG TPA: glycosyltransferase [Bacillota bacterium]|nr:glycosyltransferase [Bacillota bacterium]
MNHIETIKIISAADDRYAQHLGVMFTSLLENSSVKEGIDIYVIDGGISESSKERLNLCLSKYGCAIRFLTIKPETYQKFAVSPANSYATYFRIFIPELVDASIQKVIYLDCDMVVKGDIAKLWEIDVSQYYIAAVEDAMEYDGWYCINLKKKLGLPRRARYFNAGVLIMNLSNWRQHNISKKISDFLLNNPQRAAFADQDGLNVVLFGQWLPLPMEWNQQTTLTALYGQRKITGVDVTNAIQNPLIIHYTMNSKPWHYMNMHPLQQEYYRYLSMTPWKDFVPADRTCLNILVKSFWRTRIGNAFYNYAKLLERNFADDQTAISGKVNPIIKIGYFILFPIGYAYMRIVEKVVIQSYYLENRQGSLSFFAKILYGVVFPARFLAPGPTAGFWKWYLSAPKQTCPCCGYKTITEVTVGDSKICRLCLWENDPLQHNDSDFNGGANAVSLREARRNFQEFGASEMRFRFLSQKPGYIDENEEVRK